MQIADINALYLGFELYTLLLGLGRKYHADQRDHSSNVKSFAGKRESSRFEHSEVEQVVDEATEELKLSKHHVAVVLAVFDRLVLVAQLSKPVDDLLQEEDHREDGGSHLMTDHGGEVFCLLLSLDFFCSHHLIELFFHFLGSVSNVQGDGRAPHI